MRTTVLILALAACRLRFDEEALSPNHASRFQIGASGLTSIAAVATPAGYAVITSKAGGAVAGWTYDFQASGLAASKQNEPLATSPTGAIGAASDGGDVLLAVLDGSPASGTSLYPLGGELAATAAGNPRVGELAATIPIATGGGGFAFTNTTPGGAEIDARFVSPLAVDAGAPIKIIDATETPKEVSIVPAEHGFAVSYTGAAASPTAARIELLDANLAVVAPPITTNVTAYGAFHVRAAWAAASNKYIVTWGEKSGPGIDEVWATILGPNLETVVPPAAIAQHCVNPAVTTDDTGFWIVWKNTTTAPNVLEAAHLAPDGTQTLVAVSGAGGAPGLWTTLERSGQPVLVWTEVGGTGPDLYFDALEP